jgi:CO dehydrogenase/acetyl-CoA synthase gamma subunit (corrinoid Fe-S protein)
MKNNFITGSIDAAGMKIKKVSTKLEFPDHLGAIMVRWGISRNNYRVNPGLYSFGNPDNTSDVFVTANYKLSFDHLRKNLDGLSGWILVLDTRGVNVWCAAGKGTFGTNELNDLITYSGGYGQFKN